ncbi:MAG: G8 domain-containing protein [Actinomycetota bacterium]
MALAAAPPGTFPWSDPATWGGTLPGPNSVVTIAKPVFLDTSPQVAGVTIAEGGSLIFDPGASRTLTSTGNVVVMGRLQMRPSAASVVHKVSFANVNESNFVGGGLIVLGTDVGLWVPGSGVLDINGSPKLAWTRVAGAVAKGATTLQLSADPTGWQVGDEIVLTPTLAPTSFTHYLAYDTTTIAAISGRTITLAQATVYDHPAVAVAPGVTMTAEVLNLSRNVRIEGAPTGRAHVWIHSDQPQVVNHTQIRHVGPRKTSGNTTVGVLGRYGFHFHMAEGQSGTVADGVVVRDAGNHAFVTHMSDGLTLRNCVSHNTHDEAFWWNLGDDTNNITWDQCVASQVQVPRGTPGYYLTAFLLGAGLGNTVRNCVAVGVQGVKNANGFQWPTQKNAGVWTSEDCVAHNNKVNGIFVWQTDGDPHEVLRFTVYNNGGVGAYHGSYLNSYLYKDSTFYGNLAGGMKLAALSNGSLMFENVRFDGGGMSDYDVVNDTHILSNTIPVVFQACTFRGAKKAGIGLTREKTRAEYLDCIGCAWEGNEFWLASAIDPSSVVRVQDAVHGNISLQRSDRPGTLRPEWNARVQSISPFA